MRLRVERCAALGRPGGDARRPSREQLQPAVLQFVGVLKLVDQNVAETLLVVPPQRFVALQQFEGAQQQFGEIDHAFALALRFVGGVQLDAAPRPVVPGFDGGGAQALFLLRIDEMAQLARRELFVIDIEGFQEALDRGLLVGGIENLEQLRQAGVAMVGAQQAVAEAVKGADPHAFDVDRQHGGQARLHFLGRLVGEGHRQHAGRRDLAGGNQPGDAGGQHPRFARSGAGQNQGMCRRQGDGRELRRIEVVEQGIHGENAQSELRLYRRDPAWTIAHAASITEPPKRRK